MSSHTSGPQQFGGSNGSPNLISTRLCLGHWLVTRCITSAFLAEFHRRSLDKVIIFYGVARMFVNPSALADTSHAGTKSVPIPANVFW